MIFLLVISCNKKSEEEFPKYAQEEINNKIEEGKPFFDFDEVIHYEVSISEDEFYDLIQKDTISRETKLLSVLLFDSCPSNQDERKQFEEAIDLVRVASDVINLKFYDELRKQVFVKKECSTIEMAACEPLYRDIFIFKKNKKETGMAKICFKCRLYDFSKGNFISDCFGMNGEFGKLKNIIAENKKLKK